MRTLTLCAAILPISLKTPCIAEERPITRSTRPSALGGRIDQCPHMAEPAGLQSLIDEIGEFVEIPRLEDVVESSSLHGFNGRLGRTVRRHHDHRQLGVDLTQLFEHVEPRKIGESHVEQDRIGFLALDEVDSSSSGLSRNNPQSIRAQAPLKSIEHVFFVINDQQRRHRSVHSPAATP